MGGVSRLSPCTRFLTGIAICLSFLGLSATFTRAQPNPFGGPLSLDGFGGVSEPTLTVTLTPANAKPGDEVRLSLRLVLPPDSNTYSQDPSFEKPTEISLPEIVGLDPLEDRFVPDHPPKRGYDRVFKKQLEKFTDEVTWTRRFRLRGDVPADGAYVRGKIDYLVCDASNCVPYEESFAVSLTGAPVPPPVAQSSPQAASVDGAPGATDETIAISSFTLREVEPPSSLAMNLLFAFIGGMILNVMPCVLPVIAIKVLSFVQQAGESRGQILLLNVLYSLGVVAVFVVLATLAVFLELSWGGLFQQDWFNLVMAAVVFAMGLALLGVFEIPVPGMVGAGAGAQHREGLTGAFLTGIFATLLATPCTGPFMGTTLAWSVQQPAHVVYLVWGVMGLGMSFPYLVLGAFPALVRWLPRPGMWMVRLKEFAGFVLMGAVIFLIQSIDQSLLIPALVILVGVALGLWMIGNLYDHATSQRTKWTVRLTALALSSIVCLFGWNLQYSGEGLPWEKFSTAKVEELRKSGTPILIDFTADWCTNCKVNERLALNRRETIAFVEKHGIVALKADFTNKDPEIKEWLALCKERGVPLTLIFPRNRPNEAIPVRGVFTQATLLAKLEQAVAEVGTESVPQVASDRRTTSAPRLPASEGAAVTR